MSRRTYEKDADFVEVADDLENLVADKRISWRASATKARRRQRSRLGLRQDHCHQNQTLTQVRKGREKDRTAHLLA